MNSNRIKFLIYKFPEFGILLAVIISFTIFYVADNSIAETSTLVRMATQGTCIGFAAYGMGYLMISGEIDLSSGSVAGLTAAISGMMLDSGYSELTSYMAALSAAAMVGFLNSFMTLVIGIPSFFGTLGTSFAASGLCIWLLKGRWIYTGDYIPFLDLIFSPSPFLDFPWIFLFYIFLIILGDTLIRTSKLGTILKATGGNLISAKIAGINTNYVKTSCFILTSINFGFAGILVMGYGGTADFSIGLDWILWVIAIAIIGGGSLRGGVGSIFGTFLGVCLIQIIRIGLMNAEIQTNAQKIVVGTILIGAATFDSLKSKSKT
jgi:ribose/xylose/arabinose/galactoside ABC-type transport system permease subunit|tara:strand:- start:1651 stop:2613 length:963 start_codon:yes stop_codon:yes gene_type:complete